MLAPFTATNAAIHTHSRCFSGCGVLQVGTGVGLGGKKTLYFFHTPQTSSVATPAGPVGAGECRESGDHRGGGGVSQHEYRLMDLCSKSSL